MSPAGASILPQLALRNAICAEAQGKDFNVDIMSLFKELRADVNISINEVYEHTNSGIEGRKQLKT